MAVLKPIHTTSSPETSPQKNHAVTDELEDEIAIATTTAVKESNFQASFAEQTAVEMKKIVEFWEGSQNQEQWQSPEQKATLSKPETSDSNFLEHAWGHARLNLTISPPKAQKVPQAYGKLVSPTNTLETENSELLYSEYDDDEEISQVPEFRLNESLILDQDDHKDAPVPQVSFYPSSDVLQQSSEVDYLIWNTEQHSNEMEQTLYRTRYEAVLAELKERVACIGNENENMRVSQATLMKEDAGDHYNTTVKRTYSKFRRFLLVSLLFNSILAILLLRSLKDSSPPSIINFSEQTTTILDQPSFSESSLD
jgi:hypothetical protein